MMRISLSCDEKGDFYLWNKYIPILSRELNSQNWNNPPKLHITDGVNRIDLVRRNNYKYILAEVEESFKISKDEMKELGDSSLNKNRNIDQENYNELINNICNKLNEFKNHKYTLENLTKEKLDYIVKFRSYLYSNTKLAAD